jgi:hypothetical protein
MKIDIRGFFETVQKIKVLLKSEKNNGYFTLLMYPEDGDSSSL